MQLGKEMGLEGEKLLTFVQNQQKCEQQERGTEEEAREEKRRKLEEERRREQEKREARRQERELRKNEMETELLKQKEATEAATREHELELARLGREQNPAFQVLNREDRAKVPKLPSLHSAMPRTTSMLTFSGLTDLHLMQNGTKPDGPLSALLSEHARDVYSRVSAEDAINYDKMKLALMKMYDLTENGYRRKLRESKPETGESRDQFLVHLSTYLVRWLELSNTEQIFQGIKDLIVKEQFISSCLKELAVHLRERAPETLEEMLR